MMRAFIAGFVCLFLSVHVFAQTPREDLFYLEKWLQRGVAFEALLSTEQKLLFETVTRFVPRPEDALLDEHIAQALVEIVRSPHAGALSAQALHTLTKFANPIAEAEVTSWVQEYIEQSARSEKKGQKLLARAYTVLDEMARNPRMSYIALYRKILREPAVERSIRRDAVLSLVTLAQWDRSAAQTLMSLLFYDEVTKKDRKYIVEQLGQFPESFSSLKRFAESETHDLAMIAQVVTALGQIHHPEVIAALSNISDRLEATSSVTEQEGWTREKVLAHINRTLAHSAQRYVPGSCFRVL